MNKKKIVAVCAVLGVTLAGLALTAPAANADPVSNSYTLVGSDTLQDSANALANGTTISNASVRVTAGGTTIGSFDAFGSASIQTKPTGPYFARPAGSGDGVNALRASIAGTSYSVSGNATPAKVISGQVDIARSSGGPGTNADANGVLEYFQYGRDAVSYAYAGNTGAGTGTGVSQLTLSQLNQIYTCSLTTVNGIAVTPTIPQVGSGTAKFFLGAIGLTSAQLGSCVTQNVAENDGTVLTTAGQLVPFSVASYVAQKNQAAQDRTGSAVLGSTQGSTAPYSGSGTALVPNSAFYSNTTWGRDTYVVVEYARVNPSSPTYDANLAGLVDPTKAKSLTNFGSGAATSGAVKTKFGFLAPSTTVPIRAYPLG